MQLSPIEIKEESTVPPPPAMVDSEMQTDVAIPPVTEEIVRPKTPPVVKEVIIKHVYIEREQVSPSIKAEYSPHSVKFTRIKPKRVPLHEQNLTNLVEIKGEPKLPLPPIQEVKELVSAATSPIHE